MENMPAVATAKRNQCQSREFQLCSPGSDDQLPLLIMSLVLPSCTPQCMINGLLGKRCGKHGCVHTLLFPVDNMNNLWPCW